MDAREARKEFQAGRLPAEQLLDLLQRQEHLVQRLRAEVERLKRRLAPYEPEVRQEATPRERDDPTPSASYGLDAEEQRRRPRRRRRKKSPGRRPTHLKCAQAECFEYIYPDGVHPADCQLLRERPEVEPTNNFTERLQRGPALDRKAGRTSQTAAGAHRRTVIVSVLESLRANLEAFTLSCVLEEVQRWLAEGLSRFGRQWQALLGRMPTAAPDTG